MHISFNFMTYSVLSRNIMKNYLFTEKRMNNVNFSGDHFWKDPVTYRARKAILETMIRLPLKAALLICSGRKER